MRRLFIAALVLSMAVGGARPAAAATTEAVASGVGSFSPGLWITSPAQSVSIHATAEGVFGSGLLADTGVVSCTFSGTEVNSQATFGGGCSGTGILGPISLNCSFASQRLVLAFSWRGTCTVSTAWGSATSGMGAEWTIVPTSVSPITTFATTGELHAVPTGS